LEGGPKFAEKRDEPPLWAPNYYPEVRFWDIGACSNHTPSAIQSEPQRKSAHLVAQYEKHGQSDEDETSVLKESARRKSENRASEG
jgi:hypothetical protein